MPAAPAAVAALSLFDVESILRIGAFGCFLGHGWIAAWKLEYGPWSKFTEAAGFRDSEAQVRCTSPPARASRRDP